MDTVRHTLLAALAALAFCLLAPFGVAAADRAGLERRIAGLEADLARLNKQEERYRLAEAELMWHLSAARRRTPLVAELATEHKKLDALQGESDQLQIQSLIGEVQSAVAKLQGARGSWQQTVAEARQVQDEVCAHKNRLDSHPAPSAGEITRWLDSDQKDLENAGNRVRDQDEALNAAWSSLAEISHKLELQVARLKERLARREALEAAHERVYRLAAEVKEYQKDLAAALEPRSRMKALRLPLTRDPAIYRTNTLAELRAEVSAFSAAHPDADTAALTARLDTAEARLSRFSMYLTIPEVDQLAANTEELVSLTMASNPAAVRASFEQAGQLASQAEGALSDARTALRQTSMTQAGFGGLDQARKCLEFLRQAAGGGPGQEHPAHLVGQLRSRMEEAARRERVFVQRNHENAARHREAERMAQSAEQTYEVQKEVPGELFKRLGPMDYTAATEEMERLLSELRDRLNGFRLAGQALAQAAAKLRQLREEICRWANRAPTVGEQGQEQFKRAKQNLIQAGRELDSSARATAEKAREVASRMRDVRAAKERLAGVRDKLNSWLQANRDMLTRLREAIDLWKQAEGIERKVAAEIKDLGELKRSQLIDLDAIRKDSTELGRRLADPAGREELGSLANRAAEMAGRYQKAEVMMRSAVLPATANQMGEFVYVLNSRGLEFRESLTLAAERLKQADDALAQTEEAQQAVGRQVDTSEDAMAQAQGCLSSWAEAMAAGNRELEQLRQALAECDFDRAEQLIAGLGPGTDKQQLVAELANCRTLQAEVVSLVEEARTEHEACRYDQAMALLEKAKGKAQCRRHLQIIDQAIAKANEGSQLEAELQDLVKQSQALYNDCRFDKARPILERALAKTQCRNRQEIIRKEIELNDQRRRHEEATIKLFEQADELYRQGKYQDALARLRQARERTACERFGDSLGKKIALVQRAMAAAEARERQVEDEGEQEPSVEPACAGLLQQLREQAEEIRRRMEDYHRLTEAAPPAHIAQTGPAGCAVEEASERFLALEKQVRDAGCVQASEIKNPVDTSAAYAQQCRTWRGGGGSRQDEGHQQVTSSITFRGRIEQEVHYRASQANRKTCPTWQIRCVIAGPDVTAEVDEDGATCRITLGRGSLCTPSNASKIGLVCGDSIKIKEGMPAMTLSRSSDGSLFVYVQEELNFLVQLMCWDKRCPVEAKAWLEGDFLHWELKGATSYDISLGCGLTTANWVWRARMQKTP